MIKGLYRSASAMIPRIKQQDTIANNLANASSPGFKRDMVFTKELSRAQIKTIPRQTDWQTPMIDQVYTRFEQGSLDRTGNPLDLALEGTGFFVFQNADGENVLSRAGNLTVSTEGFLVDSEGKRLLSDGGPINVSGGEVSVSESGQVQVNGSDVANIQVVDVPDKTKLQKTGDGDFRVPDNQEIIQAVKYAVRQGYLEASNVNVVKEMVDMIISYRNFEADAKAIQAQDDSLEKLLNNVGRVR
ncbi:MAG: flagellar basal-body rod protein FlgF [candidate division Zixibacteria bacterium HGW-Zixibacteria-1]|nr:MAG: flagellar basal-body rod protein FlgF [candidate division Zixibacteria bacterium HGW-Zixibacteria-1]